MIVIAIDSFKGCLSSREANAAALSAVDEGVAVPVADGGEGTAAALCTALGGEMVECPARDPLGRRIVAEYARCGDLAVVDVAAAIGLPLLSEDERNPLETTTEGVGDMVLHAARHDARRIMVALGGSSTNDCATGMLSVLGFTFRDHAGQPLRGCGANLEKTESITGALLPELQGVELVALYDVDSPAYGPRGAAEVFGPQKGASADDVARLDRGVRHLADVAGADAFVRPGAGAAGAMGGGLGAIGGVRLLPGAETVLETVGFDSLLDGADLVITGEGSIDAQTLMGKTPAAVLAHARSRGIPVVALAGRVSDRERLLEAGFRGVICINPPSLDPATAMRPDVAAQNIAASLRGFLV